MRPTFSIIIPAYNLGNLICQSIESCLRQEDIAASEYEIIVINDGSIDDTGIYIAQYSGYKNLHIITQCNAGLSAARNAGMKAANGEYIIFLDGDDWLASNALSTIEKALDGNVLLLFPMIYYYDTDNQQKKGYGLKETMYDKDEFLHLTLGKSYYNVIPAPNKCYKADILKNNGIEFINGILHEDNPFFISAIYCYGKVRYIDKDIYYYRQKREGSITSTQTIKNFNSILAGNKIIAEITGLRNRDVNHLLSSLNIFQPIMKYRDPKDKAEVMAYYRRATVKRFLLHLLIHSTCDIKNIIKLSLLIIDPALLQTAIKMK